MTPRLVAALIHIVALFIGGTATMAQEVTQGFDFDQVVTSTFWQQLYPAGGWTLLCGQEFDAARRLPDGRAVAVDHVYPLARMVRESGCRDRAQCRVRLGEKFALMESDLHNLYPEVQELIAYRNGREFGIVDGEEWRFDDCDVEWRNGVFEPRQLARGNIARAILYMRATYRLAVSDKMLELLKAWNREDPPSKQEQERNAAIEKLQGRRNPFIDNPARVENLRNLRR
jgi:deoxyribonuclease-1